jgi:hypothetical protein
MFGLNLIPPLVRTALAMLIVGGLMGYAGTAFTTTLVADSGILGGGGESTDAHKYMMALLKREADSLSQLRPAADVVSRALDQQNASQQAQDVKPLSVTYLGGSSSGRWSRPCPCPWSSTAISSTWPQPAKPSRSPVRRR